MKTLFTTSLILLSLLNAADSNAQVIPGIPGDGRVTRLDVSNYQFEILNTPYSVVVFHARTGAMDNNAQTLINLREMASFYASDLRVQFHVVDVFAEPFLASQMSIRSYPTAIIYRMGEESRRLEGFFPIIDLFEALQETLLEP